MKRACPYCEAVRLEETETTGVERCAACGRSSLSRDRTESIGERRAPGDGASTPAALWAAGAAVLFYVFLALLPASRASELFLDRGWVPYVITGVSAWALALLVARVRRLQVEATMLKGRLLPLDLDLANESERGASGIAPSDVESALAVLHERAVTLPDSFLVARLRRALRHFESRRRVVEVVDYLSAESTADAVRVDASYSLVRVFIWAVPTLGFIGTVIGIGAAVGGFSETLEAAASIESMKDSIGTVTSGLGVAFDTTLLALVMSILIMFPASAVQRREENFLDAVDDYCAEELVRRLIDEEASSSSETAVTALAQALVREMRAAEP